MDITSNTFFYFYSTIAQCLAAITGLTFVAIQMRISFTDNKLTSAKRALIAKITGPAHIGHIDFEMNTKTVTELISSVEEFEGAQKRDAAPFLNELKLQLDIDNKNRSSSVKLVLLLLFGTFLPIIQMPFSEYVGSSNFTINQRIGLLLLNIIFCIILMYFVLGKLKEVLNIETKIKS